MGLSVMENAPNMEQQLRYANNAGQGQFISSEHWLGEANMGNLGLEDMRGMGDGGQITNAVTTGIQSIAQAFSQMQANKRGAKGAAPAKSNPPAMSQQHASGGEDGWLDGGTKTWMLVGGVALLAFILFFAFGKKKSGGGEHHHHEGE